MKVSQCLGGALVCGSVLVGTTHAEDDWTNTRESFICRSSTEVREIKTYVAAAAPADAPAGVSCRVDYIKNGATQTIYSSHTARAFCDAKAVALAARLQAGNFTCKPLHSG
jgi:hypothetical protein